MTKTLLASFVLLLLISGTSSTVGSQVAAQPEYTLAERESRDPDNGIVTRWVAKVFKDGTETSYGSRRTYLSDGTLIQETWEVNTKVFGPLRQWYRKAPNQLQQDKEYLDGREHGLQRAYWENGQRKYEYTCKFGRKVGPYRLWHSNGQLSFECECVNGHYHGPSTEWFENGVKAVSGNYDTGLQVGEWTYWFDNSQVWTRGPFVAGKKDGDWSEWGRDGKLVGVTAYKDGLKVFK